MVKTSVSFASAQIARRWERQKARLQSAQDRAWESRGVRRGFEVGERGRRAGGEGDVDEEGGLRAMMVELAKQMHLQNEVAVERAVRARGRRVRKEMRRRIGFRIVAGC